MLCDSVYPSPATTAQKRTHLPGRKAHGDNWSIPFGCCSHAERCQRGGSPGRATPRPVATIRYLVLFAVCSSCQEENQFNFCWKCGVQPARTVPVPRYPQRPPVVVDADKIQARRSQVLAAMEGRPGELQNLADEFDSFLLAYLAGSRGWTTATVDDLVDFLCFRDTQGKGTNMVHEASCPRVGRAGDDECREESSCARRYAAESLRKGCVS